MKAQKCSILRQISLNLSAVDCGLGLFRVLELLLANTTDFECEIPNVSAVEILLKTTVLSYFDYKATLLPLPLQRDLHAVNHSAP